MSEQGREVALERESRAQWGWMIFQCAVSVAVGCYVVWDDGRLRGDGHGSVLAGVIAGFLAARAVMFLIAWMRFGWRAARTMRMLG